MKTQVLRRKCVDGGKRVAYLPTFHAVGTVVRRHESGYDWKEDACCSVHMYLGGCVSCGCLLACLLFMWCGASAQNM